MTDPALEAAQQAIAVHVGKPWPDVDPDEFDASVGDVALAAARAALAPVREWHEEWLRYLDGLASGGDHIRAVLRDLPPLIYPSEEL